MNAWGPPTARTTKQGKTTMTKTFGTTRRRLLGGMAAAGAAATLGWGGSARANTFPARDINWLVYQAPGGSLDTTTRIIQPVLAQKLGVALPVENLTGAGGRIARARLTNARADGYTIMTDNSNTVVLGELFFDGPYDSLAFEPIFGWERAGYQICVVKDSPIRTFQDLYDLSQTRRVTVADIGHGGDSHLQLLIMREQLGMDLQLVHFSGSSEAYAALLGGHVDAAMAGAGSGARNIDNLHFLGVTNPDREFALPDVPSFKEQGFDFDIIIRTWYAHTTPGVPEERIQILADAFAAAFEDEAMVAQQNAAGISGVPVPREVIKQELEAFKAQAIRFQDLLKA